MSDHSSDLILVEHRDGAHVVRFLSEALFDPIVVSQLEQQILGVVAEAETPRVVLTLDTVDHIASSTLSTLIRVRSACQGKGGDAVLAAVPAGVTEVLKVARLDDIFKSYATPDEALAAFDA